MKLYSKGPMDPLVTVCRVTAMMTNQPVQFVTVDEDFRKSAEYKAMTTTDKFPLLKTDEGCLQETSAICKYFAQMSGKMLGSNAIQRSQVDQWISWTNTTISFQIYTVLKAVFGWAPVKDAEYKDALKDLKNSLRVVENALKGKQFLVGDSMSVADIFLSSMLIMPFQTALDGGFRKSIGGVDKWAKTMYATKDFQAVFGTIKMCEKPCKANTVVEKKEEKKKEAPKPVAEKEEKEEKPKSYLESLPESKFDLYSSKTFYVNHKDQKGVGMDELYKLIDFEGWTFWKLKYEIYEDEGAKEHIANNLMGGFLSRAEFSNKWTFGKHYVMGQLPNLQIQGCWLIRGKDRIPDELLKDHPQMEYYQCTKLDPRNNADDDKLVKAYFGGVAGDTIDGLEAVTMRWQK